MEGMELVGQLRHETVIVVDHAKEALETGLVGWHRELVHCFYPGLQGKDA